MSDEKLRTIIIDNYEPDIKILKDQLSRYDEINVIGEEIDDDSGFVLISEHNPDLVFLDIEMEECDSGIQLAKRLREELPDPPLIVFISHMTGHDFSQIVDPNNIGYITKPAASDNLAPIIKKVKEGVRKKEILASATIKSLATLAIKEGKIIHVVNPSEDILYIFNQGNPTSIHLKDGQVLKSTKQQYYFGNILESIGFCRVFASYIVNLKKIKRIEPLGKNTHKAILMHTSESIRIGGTYYNEVLKRLGLNQ